MCQEALSHVDYKNRDLDECLQLDLCCASNHHLDEFVTLLELMTGMKFPRSDGVCGTPSHFGFAAAIRLLCMYDTEQKKYQTLVYLSRGDDGGGEYNLAPFNYVCTLHISSLPRPILRDHMARKEKEAEFTAMEECGENGESIFLHSPEGPLNISTDARHRKSRRRNKASCSPSMANTENSVINQFENASFMHVEDREESMSPPYLDAAAKETFSVGSIGSAYDDYPMVEQSDDERSRNVHRNAAWEFATSARRSRSAEGGRRLDSDSHSTVSTDCTLDSRGGDIKNNTPDSTTSAGNSTTTEASTTSTNDSYDKTKNKIGDGGGGCKVNGNGSNSGCGAKKKTRSDLKREGDVGGTYPSHSGP
eukprot:Filipodium_phascolosomae@DN367_c0_g1_i1.p1